LLPLAVDDDGGLVNCNADVAAGALAGALDAEVLVLLSDVDQLRRDPMDESTALATVSGDDVREMLASDAVREGMRPKMTAALDALDAGARRVLLANGTRPHALRDALAGNIPTTEVLA
jgi:acetylglutamate kinase